MDDSENKQGMMNDDDDTDAADDHAAADPAGRGEAVQEQNVMLFMNKFG